jgi:uncharacterized protein (TIGR02598 family)
MKHHGRRAFTLVEVALAVAMVGFAVITILGLIPVALEASKDSSDATATSLIAQQLSAELSSHVRASGKFSPTPAGTPLRYYYDVEGQPLNMSQSVQAARAYYLALVDIREFASPPAHTSSETLLHSRIVVRWPVNASAGGSQPPVVPNPSETSFTLYLARP